MISWSDGGKSVVTEGFLDARSFGGSEASVDRECVPELRAALVEVALVQVAAADSTPRLLRAHAWPSRSSRRRNKARACCWLTAAACTGRVSVGGPRIQRARMCAETAAVGYGQPVGTAGT